MHKLVDLCHELARLPALAAVIEALVRPERQRLHIAPLSNATRAPVIAALALYVQHLHLVLVGNSDDALRTVEDLRQWLTPERVLLYPASETLPYEPIAPAVDVLRQRMHVLQQIQSMAHMSQDTTDATPAHALIIVAPVRALLQPTLTPAELASATIDLRLGTMLAQDTLLRRWIDQGYRVAPSVEAPGQINRRGGLVDIWPPSAIQPLRIEWFGNEIDSLRPFDPTTQRSDMRLTTATIGPACEIPLWERTLAQQRLATLDISMLRPEVRTEWERHCTALQTGESPETLTFLAPFFWHAAPAQRTLLAHLPSTSIILLNDAMFLAQIAADLHQQAQIRRDTLIAAGELSPAYPRPYALWDELGLDAGVDAENAPAAAATATHHTLLNLSSNPLDDTPGYGDDLHVLPAPNFTPTDLFGGQLRRLVQAIVTRLNTGERVAIVTSQAARIQELVAEHLYPEGRMTRSVALAQTTDHVTAAPDLPLPASFLVFHGTLDAGWGAPELNLTLYTDTEIFGWRTRRPLAERRARSRRSSDERAAFLRGLNVGDYVVHIEHGIAVYDGLVRRTVGGVERDYLSLRYAGSDRLYVPVDQVDRVARYIGAGEATPQLTRLGTQEWERAKRKARTAVQDLASELLDLSARRQTNQGHAFSPDNDWQRELEHAFPYIETADQIRVLADVKQDMEQPHPMDRLICGDVGFGKTEIALRAAFKAVQDSKQVAILVPTTILAQQHYDTFRRRMVAFPVKIEMLSRFRTTREQEAIVQALRTGAIDIVIGTHRLLSKDVQFKQLGLVIVDEEQRFGVRHKERLKQLRSQVDLLTLTATPIPRTLHMSLAGIRDLSVIETPPDDRMPIKTYVLPFDDRLVRDAILREIDRGGQVYFVHNRVHSIYHVATHLQRLIPEADIGVGHGQLDERQLEQVMLDFFRGTYDVLVCTTIIESGLDVPNANTIIIDDATHYGLAQLYQLRGRVGRSATRAYAYLLYRRDALISTEARQRLQAIQEATELGAGFRIAMRDLEIRGAGNLLGPEQSGHIAAVGFDLYSRLLEQAVKQVKQVKQSDPTRPSSFPPSLLPPAARADAASRKARYKRGEEQASHHTPASPPDARGRQKARAPMVHEKVLVSPLVTLDLPLTAYLPDDYVVDDTVRLSVYQRLAQALTPEEVRALRQELQDRFGDLPPPAMHLLIWLQLKALALAAGVSSVITTDEEFIVRLPGTSTADVPLLRQRFRRDASVKIGPQFVRLDRRLLRDAWVEKLVAVMETLAAMPESQHRSLPDHGDGR